VAAAGSAQGDRVVVLDELTATVGEDGRTAGEASAVLLADAGGGTPDANTILSDGAQDRDVSSSGKLTTDYDAGKPNR